MYSSLSLCKQYKNTAQNSVESGPLQSVISSHYLGAVIYVGGMVLFKGLCAFPQASVEGLEWRRDHLQYICEDRNTPLRMVKFVF